MKGFAPHINDLVFSKAEVLQIVIYLEVNPLKGFSGFSPAFLESFIPESHYLTACERKQLRIFLIILLKI